MAVDEELPQSKSYSAHDAAQPSPSQSREINHPSKLDKPLIESPVTFRPVTFREQQDELHAKRTGTQQDTEKQEDLWEQDVVERHASQPDMEHEVHLQTIQSPRRRRGSNQRRHSGFWEGPGDYAGLDEVALPMPVDDPKETSRSDYLEDNRRRLSRVSDAEAHLASLTPQLRTIHIQRLWSEVRVLSYLIFFSMLGTLARLSLDRLTTYTDSPISFPVLWSNFTGTFVLGFLLEISQIQVARTGETDREGSETETTDEDDQNAEGPKRLEIRKTPLYIGLSTGFCGSMTSYSSFARDTLLALTNTLPTMRTESVARSAGMDIMAMLGIVIATSTACLGALKFGAHCAIFVSSPRKQSSSLATPLKVLDATMAVISTGAWIALIVLGSTSSAMEKDPWYGPLLWSLVFAPPGCILRFYISILANPISLAFPIGTFLVNIIGTAILGMAWDLQHSVGGLVPCQLLQGVMDGFCGCLTTVSTWIAELSSLHRTHSYVYGATTLTVGLTLLIVIMGSLKWSAGWSDPVCMTAW